MSQTKAQLISDLVQALAFTATSSAPDNGLYLSAANTLSFNTNSAANPALTIDSSGRLLVGTTTPFDAGGNALTQLSTAGHTRIGLERADASIGNADVLGEIRFYASDTTNDSDYCAGVQAVADGAQANDDRPTSLVFRTNSGADAAPPERMIIDSSGNVSIHENQAVNRPQIILSAPDDGTNYRHLLGANLRVDSSGTYTTPATNISAGGWLYEAANNADNHGNMIYLSAPDTNAESSTPVERLRIDSSGRLLVGTSDVTADATLVLQGASNTADGDAILFICRGTEPTTSAAGREIGKIKFGDNSQNEAAEIRVERHNGTWTSGSSHPARINFYTTADGESTPTERMTIDSSGNVGIGVTDPNTTLHVHNTSTTGFSPADNTDLSGVGILIESSTDTGAGNYGAALAWTKPSTGNHFKTAIAPVQEGADPDRQGLAFFTAQGALLTDDPAERMRINNAGRLLIGHEGADARDDFFNDTVSNYNGNLQVESTGGLGRRVTSIVHNSSDSYGPMLVLGKSRTDAAGGIGLVSNADSLGMLSFQGADDSGLVEAARIDAVVDGTAAANDMPAYLRFFTNGGASSPTERIRITSDGYVKITDDGAYNNVTANYHELISQQQSLPLAHFRSENTSFDSDMLAVICGRTANSGYDFLVTQSGGGTDNEHRLSGDGNAYADGSWTGGGADYAEYFEWSDGNTTAEDRRGISVVLDGDKIREAVAGEEPIGVISGNPSVVGDAAWNKWNGKYLRDDFGTYVKNAEGDRQLNPDYNPDVEYVSREDRPEWDCVGLMGKLRIRKGQVTGARWIKMRDISNNVEEWLVR